MSEKSNGTSIYIFCHYSQQPPYNTMLRYHNWGKFLVTMGYDVTIIAASVVHNTTIDVIEKLGNNRGFCDGVKYFYIKTPIYAGNGFKRIRNMLAYCHSIPRFAKKHNNPDLIISSDAYVFPFVKKSYKRIPIVVDITDLWPISIIQYAGVSKYNPIIQLLFSIEKKAYTKCDALIFSMEGGIDYIHERKYRKKVLDEKVFHINMGCDLAEFDRNYKANQSELPWNLSCFNVVYCGSVRKANQVKEICDASAILWNRGYKNIHFQVYGNGDMLDELKAYVQSNSIHNINFYGRIEKNKIPFILSNSNVNLLTYKKVDLMKYGGSQSKLFDYLASGRPIISNADWGYNLITRYGCGSVTLNQSSTGLADAIEELYNQEPRVLKEMGLKARSAAEKYDQPHLVDKLCKVFAYCLKEKVSD